MTSLPNNWKNMTVFEKRMFMSDYYDIEKEEDDRGCPQLRDDTPEDIKAAYDQMLKEDKENIEKGIIVD